MTWLKDESGLGNYDTNGEKQERQKSELDARYKLQVTNEAMLALQQSQIGIAQKIKAQEEEDRQKSEWINNLMNMALHDSKRIIDGDQYNGLFKAFRPNMPDDEATKSFIAANYVMQDDYNSWYANSGYLNKNSFGETVVVNAETHITPSGDFVATISENFNFNFKKDFEDNGKKILYQLDYGGYGFRIVDNRTEQQALLKAKSTEYGTTMLDMLPWVGTGGFTKGVDATGKLFSEAERIVQGTSQTKKIIDGINVVNGKIGGKIPVEDFRNIRNESVHNLDADSITLGKYTPTVENGVENWAKPGPDSYIAKAGDKSTYFDLGSEWSSIQKRYNLTDKEMFKYFNKPALDDAVRNGKTIQFSHKPDLEIYKGSYLAEEWNYLKNEHGYSMLIESEGGIWYAK